MALDPSAIVRRIQDEFRAYVQDTHTQHGDATVSVAADRWVDVVQFCRDAPDLDMNYFRDLTVVDYIEEHPRFEVVCHLYSLKNGHAVRLKARVPEDEPEIGTIIGVYPAANWFEREAWDMYGVTFAGHPDLRRLLMYHEFEGHALRKDFPVLQATPLVEPLPTPPQRPEAGPQLVQIQPYRGAQGNGA